MHSALFSLTPEHEFAPQEEGEIDPNACVICMYSNAEGLKTTSCGHRFCDRCLVRYTEIRCKHQQPVICPVCRRLMPPKDLPKKARKTIEDYKAARALAAMRARPGGTYPPPRPVMADAAVVAASMCCCCVVIGQLHEVSRRPWHLQAARSRRMVCLTVVAMLWAFTLVSILPEASSFAIARSERPTANARSGRAWCNARSHQRKTGAAHVIAGLGSASPNSSS